MFSDTDAPRYLYFTGLTSNQVAVCDINPANGAIVVGNTDYRTYAQLSYVEEYDTTYTLTVHIKEPQGTSYVDVQTFAYQIVYPEGVTVTYGPANALAVPGEEVTLYLTEPLEDYSVITTSKLTNWQANQNPLMTLEYLDEDEQVQQWIIGSGGYSRFTNKLWGTTSRADYPSFTVTFTIQDFGSLPVKFIVEEN